VNPAQQITISDKTFRTEIGGVGCASGNNVTGSSLLLKWEERKHLQALHLGGCYGITDKSISTLGVSALGHGCGQLESIDLSGCHGITGMRTSVLGRGCSRLRLINLYGCYGISDSVGIPSGGRLRSRRITTSR
jgi:hypothetical protein